MALPALVLVHGGGLAADSWELTVEEIHRLAPELPVLALDMPGRRSKPGDLREMTIANYVDSLVGDIALHAGRTPRNRPVRIGFRYRPVARELRHIVGLQRSAPSWPERASALPGRRKPGCWNLRTARSVPSGITRLKNTPASKVARTSLT